jgi:hypothetical protein
MKKESKIHKRSSMLEEIDIIMPMQLAMYALPERRRERKKRRMKFPETRK